MSAPDVTIHGVAEPLNIAIGLLSHVAKTSPEVVLRFLNGLESGSDLVRVENIYFAAPGASHSLLILYPSKLLLDFFAALLAGDCDDL